MPPDVTEAFAASFRFVTTGPPVSTANGNGLIPPPGWTSGLKCTNFKWYARNSSSDPNAPYWLTQSTDPLVVGGLTAKSGKYKAAGNPFTINIIGYNSASVISNAQIQVSAYTKDDAGNMTFMDPPFKGYVWGLWDGQAALNDIPARTGDMTVFIPASEYTLSYPADPDEQGTALYQFPIISLVFKDNLRGIVASQGKFFLDVALYFNLDDRPCFDDPEMEIDLGSN